MIEVSLSQLRAFIQAQPDDKPHAQNEMGYHSPTGNFLVHYGKAQGWEFNFMAYKSWVRYTKQGVVTHARMKGQSYWLNLFRPDIVWGTTYGELKRQML